MINDPGARLAAAAHSHAGWFRGGTRWSATRAASELLRFKGVIFLRKNMAVLEGLHFLHLFLILPPPPP